VLLSTSTQAMTLAPPEWLISDAPVAYPEAMVVMENRVDKIIAGIGSELIWMLEHPPLYTKGTSAQISELIDSARFPVYETGRGGRYTYHGPGQRIIYALTDLRQRGKDIRRHVWNLEEWVIRVLGEWGVKAERRPGRIGLWVCTGPKEAKIAAIGVRVRKWVAFHGLSLNIDPDLSHYSGIVPCGIADYGVTSLRQLGIEAKLKDIDAAFKKHGDILGFNDRP